MKSPQIILTILIVLILGVLGYAMITAKDKKDSERTDSPSIDTTQVSIEEFTQLKNLSFTIDGQTIQLVNGLSETEIAPGSSSKVTTTYFGNEAVGDLNKDELNDIAFLVTQNSGGSGTFYYVIVALKTPDGYKTTNAFLIGDRIAPQNTEIRSNELHVNFAERKDDESMTVEPSVGSVLLLKVTSSGVLEGLMK